jgi:adenine-specific DNA-methyltransferase
MGRPGRKAVRLAYDGPSLLELSEGSRNQKTSPEEWSWDSRAPEDIYAARVDIAHRRRFGQFFTPPKIAAIMADWTCETNPRTLLDPAVGMGILVRTARAKQADLMVTSYEKDPVILNAYHSTKQPSGGIELIHADFLVADVDNTFDSFLMNPPYLRHHDMDYGFDIFADYSARYGTAISKLSNSYVLFLIKCCELLNPKGRGAAIVPAEWMNANFGKALKEYLIQNRLLREIIYFSNCSEIFDDALTTASILLIEKDSP